MPTKLHLIAKHSDRSKGDKQMALTRKYLSALGIEADKIDEIIEAHSETVNALKSERDEYKEKAVNASELQKKLDEANEKLETATGDGYQSKYEDLKKEFDAFKADTDAKAVLAVKDKAYRQMLKDCGVSEKRIDAVMKLTDLSEIELDGEKVKDADKVKEEIRSEWSDFITSETHEGAGTNNPPAEEETHQSTVVIPTIF